MILPFQYTCHKHKYAEKMNEDTKMSKTSYLHVDGAERQLFTPKAVLEEMKRQEQYD